MPQPMSKNEEIEAMIDGTFVERVRELGADEVTFRDFITVGREDLEQYLRNNPKVMRTELQSALAREATHERAFIRIGSSGYDVSQSDHGVPVFTETFQEPEAALAQLILLDYGSLEPPEL